MKDDAFIPTLNRFLTELELAQLEATRLVGRLASLNVRGLRDAALERQVDQRLDELEALEAEAAHHRAHHPTIKRPNVQSTCATLH